jgi:hypothetical protein
VWQKIRLAISERGGKPFAQSKLESFGGRPCGIRYPNGRIQQSLAADGAIACFSNSFVSSGLNADRAPQLKAQRYAACGMILMRRLSISILGAILIVGFPVLRLSAGSIYFPGIAWS